MSTEETKPPERKRLPAVFRIGLIVFGIIGLIVLAILWRDSEGEKKLGIVVAAKNDTINILRADTLKIRRQLERVAGEYVKLNGVLESERAATVINQQTYQSNLDQALALMDRKVDAMSASQKKAAADLAQARIDGKILPTTVNDSVANGTIAKLEKRVEILRDSTRTLTAALGRKDAQIKTITEEVSDLEQVLNSDNGYNNVRTLAQNKRAAASKGLGKILKSGQIKVLGQVDSALAAQQQERAYRIQEAKDKAAGVKR